MKRLKKRSRFLRVFFLVLCFSVAFSVTTFATTHGDYEYADGLKYTDGDLVFDIPEGNPDDYFALYVYRDSYIYYHVVNGGFTKVEEGTYEPIDHLFNRASGKYIDWHVGASGKDTVMFMVRGDVMDGYYDVVPIRIGAGYGASAVMETISFSVKQVSDFITQNAILLLFAVILPVVSFGGGFLIRLKHRT